MLYILKLIIWILFNYLVDGTRALVEKTKSGLSTFGWWMKSWLVRFIIKVLVSKERFSYWYADFKPKFVKNVKETVSYVTFNIAHGIRFVTYKLFIFYLSRKEKPLQWPELYRGEEVIEEEAEEMLATQDVESPAEIECVPVESLSKIVSESLEINPVEENFSAAKTEIANVTADTPEETSITELEEVTEVVKPAAVETTEVIDIADVDIAEEETEVPEIETADTVVESENTDIVVSESIEETSTSELVAEPIAKEFPKVDSSSLVEAAASALAKKATEDVISPVKHFVEDATDKAAHTIETIKAAADKAAAETAPKSEIVKVKPVAKRKVNRKKVNVFQAIISWLFCVTASVILFMIGDSMMLDLDLNQGFLPVTGTRLEAFAVSMAGLVFALIVLSETITAIFRLIRKHTIQRNSVLSATTKASLLVFLVSMCLVARDYIGGMASAAVLNYVLLAIAGVIFCIAGIKFMLATNRYAELFSEEC